VSDAYLYSITALRLHHATISTSGSASSDDDTLAVADDNGSVCIVSLQHGVLQTIDTPLKQFKTVWSVCAIDDNR
jgi:hypothetical protein